MLGRQRDRNDSVEVKGEDQRFVFRGDFLEGWLDGLQGVVVTLEVCC